MFDLKTWEKNKFFLWRNPLILRPCVLTYPIYLYPNTGG